MAQALVDLTNRYKMNVEYADYRCDRQSATIVLATKLLRDRSDNGDALCFKSDSHR